MEEQRSMIEKILSNKPIAFRPDFGHIFGGAVPGLFLSQIFYWHDKGNSEWIYKTQKEMEAETCLSRREQERARRILEEKEVIEVKKKGTPARLHYKLNVTKIVEYLEKYHSTAKLVCTDPPNKFVQNEQTRMSKTYNSSITKNTTKNTTKDNSSLSTAKQKNQNGSFWQYLILTFETEYPKVHKGIPFPFKAWDAKERNGASLLKTKIESSFPDDLEKQKTLLNEKIRLAAQKLRIDHFWHENFCLTPSIVNSQYQKLVKNDLINMDDINE
jgi:hypothetical protein